jgi:hypothetical protein
MSTVPPGADAATLRRGVVGRSLFALGLAVFLVAMAAGVAGPSMATAGDRGEEYRLTVRYSSVTRPGVSAPWSAEVERLDGAPIDEEVALVTTSEYFGLFDEHGLDPTPDAATSDGELDVWRWDPPGTAAFSVSFDARAEASWHRPVEATTRLVVGDETVAQVTYETKVAP